MPTRLSRRTSTSAVRPDVSMKVRLDQANVAPSSRSSSRKRASAAASAGEAGSPRLTHLVDVDSIRFPALTRRWRSPRGPTIRSCHGFGRIHARSSIRASQVSDTRLRPDARFPVRPRHVGARQYGQRSIETFRRRTSPASQQRQCRTKGRPEWITSSCFRMVALGSTARARRHGTDLARPRRRPFARSKPSTSPAWTTGTLRPGRSSPLGPTDSRSRSRSTERPSGAPQAHQLAPSMLSGLWAPTIRSSRTKRRSTS